MEEEEKRKEKEEKTIQFMENRKGKKKSLRFSVFRRSEVDGPRIKVVLLDESYE